MVCITSGSLANRIQIISIQHVRHRGTSCSCDSVFNTLCNLINVVNMQREKQRGQRAALLHTCVRVHSSSILSILQNVIFFFLGWCYSYGPQQGPDRQQKNEERGLKQRRKQKEAAQGDPEPKKGNQEKEKKNQVEYRVEGAQDRRRRRKPGGWKETPNTRKKKGGRRT